MQRPPPPPLSSVIARRLRLRGNPDETHQPSASARPTVIARSRSLRGNPDETHHPSPNASPPSLRGGAASVAIQTTPPRSPLDCRTALAMTATSPHLSAKPPSVRKTKPSPGGRCPHGRMRVNPRPATRRISISSANLPPARNKKARFPAPWFPYDVTPRAACADRRPPRPASLASPRPSAAAAAAPAPCARPCPARQT